MTENINSFLSRFSKSGTPVTDISRIKHLLKLVGNPQQELKFVHIAGTNGKGSTAAYIAEILMSAGYKTGLFTSPFMLCYNDRIRVNGENIPDEALERIIPEINAVVENDEYSQFEITQTAAFMYFKEMQCDIVVLETGIGGKNDSTNVIEPPLVSVITSVSFDHTAVLGNTLLEIAAQKAGIIKSGSNVVLSPVNNEEVTDFIMQRAYELECNAICPPYTSLEIKRQTLTGAEFSYKGYDYTINMGGEHQIANAQCAIETVEFLNKRGFEISPEHIIEGLNNTSVPMRMEKVCSEPLVIIDGAHNPDGMKALCSHISEFHSNKMTVILGMLSSKDSQKAARLLAQSGIAADVLCVDGFYPAALSSKELADMLKEQNQFARALHIDLCLDIARDLGRDILICGSLYLCTEMRGRIAEKFANSDISE